MLRLWAVPLGVALPLAVLQRRANFLLWTSGTNLNGTTLGLGKIIVGTVSAPTTQSKPIPGDVQDNTGTTACDQIVATGTANPYQEFTAQALAGSIYNCASADIDSPFNMIDMPGGAIFTTDTGYHMGNRQVVKGTPGNLGGTAATSGTQYRVSANFPLGTTPGTLLATATAGSGTVSFIRSAGATTLILTPPETFTIAGDPSSTVYYIKNCVTGSNNCAGSDTSLLYCLSATSNACSSGSTGTITVQITPVITTGFNPTNAAVTLTSHPVWSFGDTNVTAANNSPSGESLENGQIVCTNASGVGTGLLDNFAQENSQAKNIGVINCGRGIWIPSAANTGDWLNLNITYTSDTYCPATTIPFEISGAHKRVSRVTITGNNCAAGKISKGIFHATNAQLGGIGAPGGITLDQVHGEAISVSSPAVDMILVDSANPSPAGITGPVEISEASGCPKGASTGECLNLAHIASNFVGTFNLHDSSCNLGTTNVLQDDINSQTFTCAHNPHGSGTTWLDGAGGFFTTMNPSTDQVKGWNLYNNALSLYTAASTTPFSVTATGAVVGTTINATTGLQIGGTAPLGHCPIGNGTNYVDSSGCGSTVNNAAQYLLPYYSGAGTTNLISGLTWLSGYDGVPQLMFETTSSGSPTIPAANVAGVPIDATNPATLLITDRANFLNWTSGTSLALPSLGSTGFGANDVFVLRNTEGATLTITPNAGHSDKCDGASTCTILTNWSSFVYSDSSTNWDRVYFPNFAAFPACADSCGNHINFTTAAGFTCGTSNSASVYTAQVNGSSLSAGDTINFNNTTPAAGSNGLNVQFQTSKVSSTDSVSAQIVGDGTVTHFLNGTGTFTTPAGSGGTVSVVSSGNLTSTALVTGGGTQLVQTPSATTTLDGSGNLSVAAGGSVGSADTGTPKFTFGTSSITANQPIIHTPTARTSGVLPYWKLTIPTDTGLTAATEAPGFQTVTATRTWATTGTVATQRENLFVAPTYASASASQTFTKAATLAVSNAPQAGSNAIITNPYSIWAQAGLAEFDGGLASTTGVFSSTLNVTSTVNLASLTASLLVCTDASKNLSSTCTNLITLADLPQLTADSVYQNETGSTAAPTAVAIPSCSAGTSALTYNTTTHAWGCNTISGGVTSVNTLTGAAVIEAATAGQMAVSGGASAALTGAADMTYSTHTFATTANGIFDWSAATGAGSLKFPAVVGGTSLAGTSTANLSAPIVISNLNSTNNNTSITMGITAPGTSTGQVTLNVNGATTGAALANFGTGGTWASGVLSGQTVTDQILPTGQLSITQTAGTSTAMAITNSTAATSGTAQSSPFDIRTGQTWLNYFPAGGGFIAAASQADCWSHQVTETNGTNGSSIYVLLHNSAADNCQGSPANSYLQTPFEYNWGVQTNTLSQPSTPVITHTGTGSGTWTYTIVACIGPTCTQASASGSCAAACNTTANATNYPIITWTPTANADYYKVYRTVSGGTPSSLGIIAVIPSGSTASGASCSASTCVVNDEGLTGDTTSAQAYNSTGQVYVGTGPAVGGGTGGGMFSVGGTVPSTLSATAAGWYASAAPCFDIVNGTTDQGCAIGTSTAQTMSGAKTFSGGIINTTTPIRDQTRFVLVANMTAVTATAGLGTTGAGNTTFSWPVTTANWYDMQCKLPNTFASTGTIKFLLYSVSGGVTISAVNSETMGNTGAAAVFQDLTTIGGTTLATSVTPVTGAPAASETITYNAQFLTSHAGNIGLEFTSATANSTLLAGGECGLTQIN